MLSEEEKVCQTCFYDGCEVCCSRCSEWYHLECVKLKRQPRTDFVCKKCKTNETQRTRRRPSHGNAIFCFVNVSSIQIINTFYVYSRWRCRR